jgi:ornithine cyclodeaminase/alanine dehydrogenase-like protein (mu-crystallin family)
MSGTPVFVSADAARTVFRWADAVDALRVAYGTVNSASATPPRSIAAEGSAWLRVLPSMPSGGRYFGAKLMGSPGTTTPPRVEYVIVLFDRQTGSIAAFLDGNIITGLRTAATSAVALDRLAPRRPLRLAVLGSGFEATMHTRALASIRELSNVAVFSPTPHRRAAFADAVSDELGVPARAAETPQEAVTSADVVIAAARSRGEAPIVYGEWLAPGAVVASIGSTVPQQREIDVSVVERVDLIVCDVLDEVFDSTGDMIAATAAGIEFRHKAVSLTGLLSGACEQRVDAAANLMFKSVGSGLQDIVVAELVLTNALHAGLATELPIAFETKD